MNKLPILMYHCVSENEALVKGLTVSKKQLESQLNYLVENGYKTYFFSELKKLEKLAPKSVVITFDDVTKDQLLHAYPLLKKYGLKATFFVPFGYVGKSDLWNEGKSKIMTVEELKSLDPSVIELGHHSYEHSHYNELIISTIEKDIQKGFEYAREVGLDITYVIAYPYGKFPRAKEDNIMFKKMLKANNLAYGLRIGNRVNQFPFSDDYEINRIDIKGEDSLFKFKLKLKFGKFKLF